MISGKQRWLFVSLFYFMIVILAVVSLVPLYWTVLTAFRPQEEAFTYPPSFVPSRIVFDNIRSTWKLAPFGRFFFNTLVVTAACVSGQIVFGSLAAYAFARMEFPGRDFLFLLILGGMMIPPVITLIPLFIMMRQFRWIDTYYALIMPYLWGQPIGLFLFRQFFLTIPKSLEDAATIDGCGHLRIFQTVIVPNASHAFLTVAVITFVFTWNNFLWPLIVTNRETMKVLSVAIATTFQSEKTVLWTNLMSAATLSVAPLILLFLVAQKNFVESIQLSGIK